MTVRLEELLAAALGDDPWYYPNYGEIRTKHQDEIRLIALAPDAVRLLIDMGEALRAVRGDNRHDYEKRRALLARLDRLGNTA